MANNFGTNWVALEQQFAYLLEGESYRKKTTGDWSLPGGDGPVPSFSFRHSMSENG